jgi:hypothetical protein
VTAVLALVHDDGHVWMTALGPSSEANLHFNTRMLGELGVTGWHEERLEEADATARGLARVPGCTVCVPHLPCGCGLGTAQHGGCPHGGQALILAAADKITGG